MIRKHLATQAGISPPPRSAERLASARCGPPLRRAARRIATGGVSFRKGKTSRSSDITSSTLPNRFAEETPSTRARWSSGSLCDTKPSNDRSHPCDARRPIRVFTLPSEPRHLYPIRNARDGAAEASGSSRSRLVGGSSISHAERESLGESCPSRRRLAVSAEAGAELTTCPRWRSPIGITWPTHSDFTDRTNRSVYAFRFGLRVGSFSPRDSVSMRRRELRGRSTERDRAMSRLRP